MVLSLLSVGHPGFGTVRAASNENTTAEGNSEDVFAALGFDISTVPEGFDEDSTSNPYGRDKLLANQVSEVLLATSGGTRLYGHNDNNVSPANLGGYSTEGASMPSVKLFAGAPGDFDADGLPGEIAYVGIDDIKYGSSDAANLILYVYDSATGTYSAAKNIGAVSPYYTIADDARGKNQTRMDAAWQNLLQITTGDYDGDGISEIAVYVAESGNARVDIYKYQKTASSPGNAWLTMGNWARAWSYAVSSAEKGVPNMVSLCSGDFNRDGIDDLGIAYGRAVYQVVNLLAGMLYSFTDNCMEYTPSSARILWGGESSMLQANSPLDLDPDNLGSLARVSLTYGDVDADGTKDLVMAGESVSDLSKNTTRSIAVYAYDATEGLVVISSSTLKVVDAEYKTKYDSEGNPNGTEITSNNGYDVENLSSPAMRCNAAVVTPDRNGDSYIYVDSTLYKYYETSLSIAYELDDKDTCDGGSTETTLMWAGANNTSYSGVNISSSYCEYGAVSGDINGQGNQILMTNYIGTRNYMSNLGTYTGYCALYAGGTAGVTVMNQATASVTEVSGGGTEFNRTPVAITMPDTDIDTTIIEYTGIHYLTYSDPKVLAVIAAAPYFEDVDNITGNDYAWENTTTWATTSVEVKATLFQWISNWAASSMSKRLWLGIK